MTTVARSGGTLLRVLIGALTFGIVQAALFANPPAPIGPPIEDPGWFLNSVPGVLIVAAVFLLVGGLSVTLRPVDIATAATPVSVGGSVAMTAVYAWLGFGNIFPIVIAFGIAQIGVATFAGAWIAYEVRVAFRRD